MSNRPWTDPEAVALKEGGKPGKGKKSILDEFNLLVLNKLIIDGHADEWTDDDIVSRSREIATDITRIWLGPADGIQQAAFDTANT